MVATNKNIEMIAATIYPKSMRHLQQLLMDADECAKNYGKKGIFGGDKFQPKFEAFQRTVLTCAFALTEDNALSDPTDVQQSIAAIDKALNMLSQAYSSWPLAFEFWDVFKSGRRF